MLRMQRDSEGVIVSEEVDSRVHAAVHQWTTDASNRQRDVCDGGVRDDVKGGCVAGAQEALDVEEAEES